MADSAISPSRIIVPSVAAPRARVTEGNFLKAMIGTAIVVLVFWVGYQVERNILQRHPADSRFIREASEAAMRYITIPHILIGFLFLWTSPKNRTREKRMWVFALLAVGAVLCTLYGLGGGRTNFILYLSVYLYFLVHEMRDEAMFYTVLGEAAPIADRAAFNKMVKSLIGLTVFAIAAVVWAPLPFGLYQGRGYGWIVFDGGLPLAAKIPVAFAPLALAIIGYQQTLRRSAARLGYAGTGSLVGTHVTLFKVMFGVVLVLSLAMVIVRRPYALILFHVVAWYVFASHQLKKNPPKAPPTSWWLWMRTTLKGFQTMHVGMALILIAIGLVWTFGLGQTPYLRWLLAPESFLYWTIMHITVSFVPR